MKENKKNMFMIVFTIVFLLLLVGGAAMAYLIARVDLGSESRIRVVTKTSDSLMFEAGEDLNLVADMNNFAEGAGNVSSSTLVKAVLKSSNAEETIYNYSVAFQIDSNEFEYTTSTKTPEILLQVTMPDGKMLESVEGLDYVTSGGVSGFDITEKTGLVNLVDNYGISAVNTTTTHEWNINIVFVNLDVDQNDNTGKELVARALIQKEVPVDIIKKRVDETLALMTLDEKIAQMTIISFNGTSLDGTVTTTTPSTTLRDELNLKPGGVILFAGNITNYANTKAFIEQIKQTASIPLFVSVDQEGGRVQRITSSTDPRVQTIPPMRNVGYKNDPELAYDLGGVIAEEVLSFGFNMDFAPDIDVVDVTSDNVIGARSFGGDPNLVSRLGTSLYNGILDKGVIPSYKHFPGHGATETDSHSELPVISKTKEELMQRDLLPFQYVIDHGAEIIMVGHLSIPSIDSEGYPASLSNTLINGLLKTEMGFKGLVITDSLQMGAITKNYPEKERYELAINAGVDILLMPQSCKTAISNIKASISEGVISEERINESVRKLLTLKFSKLATEALDESYLGSDAHKDVIARVNAE